MYILFYPKKASAVLIVTVSLVLFLSSCTTLVKSSKNSIPISGKKIEKRLGKAAGSHSTWSVLGIWMVSRPDLDCAMKRALKKNNADALTNLKIYQTTRYFLLFSVITVTVEGEAVRFEKKKVKK